MRVRRAEPGDALGIATVYVRSWQSAFRGLVPQSHLDAMSPEARVGGWAETLAATTWPRRGIFVLVDGTGLDGGGADPHGEIVTGFVTISPSRDDDADPGAVGEIQTLYLAPAAFGTGGGRLLVDAALGELRRAGFEAVTLWVLDTNARARRFYEHHGWRADGATKLNDWGTFVRTDVRYVVALD
jgi:ribosomal protein S18 acetylase RimI-like enzyme